MGDLIFFGRKATETRKESITHVGIYIGDSRFIHSSGLQWVNSLDPASDIYYTGSDRLLKAVRILNHIDDGTQALCQGTSLVRIVRKTKLHHTYRT